MPAQQIPPSSSLTDTLLELKLITPRQLDQAKLESLSQNQTIESTIMGHNWVKPQDLAKARGAYYNIPYINLSDTPASPEALNTLPEIVARRYWAFPFAIDRQSNSLSVAMANPLDLIAIEFIE